MSTHGWKDMEKYFSPLSLDSCTHALIDHFFPSIVHEPRYSGALGLALFLFLLSVPRFWFCGVLLMGYLGEPLFLFALFNETFSDTFHYVFQVAVGGASSLGDSVTDV